MIDSKIEPIAAAREALDALEHGGNWSNFDAPALVRRLLAVIDAQALTITGAQTTIAELLDERSGLLNSLAATEQQRDEARAIIEGSDVPPTEAETDANPCWLALNRWGGSTVCFVGTDSVHIGNDEYEWSRPGAIEHLSPCRWIPLDADNGFRPRKRAAVTP
jgi:hypothetical protein